MVKKTVEKIFFANTNSLQGQITTSLILTTRNWYIFYVFKTEKNEAI